MIRTILATGLAQGKLSNGMSTIYQRISTAKEPGTVVEQFSWRQWEEIPQLAERLANSHVKAEDRLVFAGHSWGVWYLNRLGVALGELGVGQLRLFSADGVNRPPKATMVIAHSFSDVWRWRQEHGLIRGSDMLLPSGCRLHIDELVECHHVQVDETPAFQDSVVKWALGKE